MDHDPTKLLTRNEDKDNWRTPPELFAGLNVEFGFTLDACASEDNALCKKFFTEETDGLKQSWANERVYMNPPYRRGLLARWVEKAARESKENGALVVGLLPATRTEQAWFHDYVLRYNAEIRWLRGRLKYLLPDGSTRSQASFPSMLVIWR